MLDALEALRRSPSLKEIQIIEAQLKASPNAVDLDNNTFHHFADGVYGRSLMIPAGVALTGKMHKKSTLNILAAGTLAVTTDEGPKILTAPAIFVSPPMCKKLGVALTDCLFVTAHASQETDIAKLEAEIIEPEEPISLEDLT